MSNYNLNNATEGEKLLFNKLIEHFGNNKEYNIYFQPFLNGMQADIIVYKKGCYPILIEIKDWQEASYIIPNDNSTPWIVKKNDCRIVSPFKQVDNYKNIIYMLLENFYINKHEKPSYFGLIKNVLYFHNFSIAKANQLDGKSKYTGVYCLESVDSLIHSIENIRANNLINDELDQIFCTLFETGFNRLYDIKERTPISEEKLKTIKQQSKVRGPAGTGKSYELASYAVYLVEQKKIDKVLIVTFNITLKHWIHDLISSFKNKDTPWSSFHIVHYHALMSSKMDEYNIEKDHFLELCNDEHIFDQIQNSNKYGALLLDEGQDFMPSWFKILRSHFLKKDGYYYIAADKGQNIYENAELDDERQIQTNIPGRWNELKKNFRLKGEIYNLASSYRTKYLDTPDTDETYDLALESKIECLPLDFEEIFKCFEKLKKEKFAFNDFAVISGYIGEQDEKNPYNSTLATFEQEYRKRYVGMKTTCSFTETKYRNKLNKMDIEKSDRNKKLAFRMNTGHVKIATVHSFKGWESPVVFLLVDKNITGQINHEAIVYTGITRAIDRLIICTNDQDLTTFVNKIKQ